MANQFLILMDSKERLTKFYFKATNENINLHVTAVEMLHACCTFLLNGLT